MYIYIHKQLDLTETCPPYTLQELLNSLRVLVEIHVSLLLNKYLPFRTINVTKEKLVVCVAYSETKVVAFLNV